MSPSHLTSAITAWTQWAELPPPEGTVTISSPSGIPSDDVLESITFYMPSYMGGRESIAISQRMPQLQVLQLPNTGYDDAVDIARPGVVMCNARGVHTESTAELAVCLAIAGRASLGRVLKNQWNRTWYHEQRRALTDCRIAIVGNGSIGQTVRRMLQGFDVDISMYSRTSGPRSEDLRELSRHIGRFDVVILTLPLSRDTVRLFDAALLSRMRTGALLVNVCRGRVIATDALISELHRGRLHAALDVTDPEPLPVDHPLWAAPNCIITPHVGGDSTAFEPRAQALAQRQLAALATRGQLENIVYDGARFLT